MTKFALMFALAALAVATTAQARPIPSNGTSNGWIASTPRTSAAGTLESIVLPNGTVVAVQH